MSVVISLAVLTAWSMLFSSRTGLHFVATMIQLLGIVGLIGLFFTTVIWSLNTLYGSIV